MVSLAVAGSLDEVGGAGFQIRIEGFSRSRGWRAPPGGAMLAPSAREEAMAEGYVTTHVLDAARGIARRRPPHRALPHRRRAPPARPRGFTNADGRTDSPVIPKGELRGRGLGAPLPRRALPRSGRAPGERPRFLDVIPIRFGIADVGEHYHVPLLLAPYSYSTYRGS